MLVYYKPSIFCKMISSFWGGKNVEEKIAIYMRSLAQGVKFTDFFLKREKHTKKSYLRCFLPQHLALVFPLEIL